jgi:sugar lactone lactonase YvrE
LLHFWRLTLEFETPAKWVTSVSFGGAELSTLFIATSRAGLSAYDLIPYPLSGAIFGIETATYGFPTRPFGAP